MDAVSAFTASTASNGEQMHIHVLGFGAIGTLVAHHLRAALDPKHLITIVHRSADHVRAAPPSVAVERDGVVVRTEGFTHVASEPEDTHDERIPTGMHMNLLAVPSEAEPTTIDSLVVATKAPYAMHSIKTLLPRLSANSTIVLLHNGMGVYEDLVKHVFRNSDARPHIVLSVNTHGAWRKGVGHVVHAGVGDIQLGIVPDSRNRDFEASLDLSLPRGERKLSLSDITPVAGDPHAERYLSLRNTISAFCSAAPLNAAWRPLYDVQLAMRRKLVVNSVVNPLTALLNCSNGEIFKHAAGTRIAERLCAEASSVFRTQWEQEVKAQARTGTVAGGPDPLVPRVPAWQAEQFPRELEAAALLAECKRIVRLTHENASSMLYDVRNGRGTEVRQLNGYLLRLARRYGVRVPVTATLLDMVVLRSAVPLDSAVSTKAVL